MDVETNNQKDQSLIAVEPMVTVGSLADKLSLPVSTLITELFKNGVMATVNEKIDFETAQIIVEELGLDVKLTTTSQETDNQDSKKKVFILSDKAKSRPPVVAVMGHVDHGKTSLLDAIRTSHVVSGEAGGITQHISAYMIKHNDRAITFLDTPGHEAFAAIREHGALLTDIVIIVVAADDGIKPQTVEAIRFARKANTKIIVAINKIDKEGADINRVKQQLSENGLLIEEWGGEIVVVPVSAKTKEGIDKLLDMILLVTDVEDLKADYEGDAEGLIIEAHLEQGKGPIAQALVVSGTLAVGNYLVAGRVYAKVKSLETTDHEAISQATPSTPVIISGFKSLAQFGDEFMVVKNEKQAKNLSEANTLKESNTQKMSIGSNELIRLINRDNKLTELNLVIKADAQGSLTSVIDSLKAMATEEVAVRIVGSGIGPISENDLYLAHSSGAVVYGFNVSLPSSGRQQASRDKIDVELYSVIYELIDSVKDRLTDMLPPEIVEKSLGKLKVKGIFKSTKNTIICGGEVLSGKLTFPAKARIIRDKKEISLAQVINLKRGNVDADEIFEGELCGMSIETPSRVDLVEGDEIELFITEEIKRKL